MEVIIKAQTNDVILQLSNLNQDDTILLLKQSILYKLGIPISSYKLIYQTEDGQVLQLKGLQKTLEFYQIKHQSQIKLTLKQNGGGGSNQFKYPGSAKSLFIRNRISQIIPMNQAQQMTKWFGLNLQAKCENYFCQVKGKLLWHPRGFGEFTIIGKQKQNCICQSCGRKASVINIGYYFTQIVINGQKKHQKEFQFTQMQTDNNIITLEKMNTLINENNNTCRWQFLKIIAFSITRRFQQVHHLDLSF